jgi:hypothetical protein
VQRGDVEVVPAVQGFEGSDVVLADRRRLAPDVVVAATGFRPGLGPLVGHLGVVDDAGRPLVTVADEHPAAPALHFVGFTPSLGGALRTIAAESQALARHAAAVGTAVPAGTVALSAP